MLGSKLQLPPTCLLLLFQRAYQQQAGLGLGDMDGLLPGEPRKGRTGGIELGMGDQEGYAGGGG